MVPKARKIVSIVIFIGQKYIWVNHTYLKLKVRRKSVQSFCISPLVLNVDRKVGSKRRENSPSHPNQLMKFSITNVVVLVALTVAAVNAAPLVERQSWNVNPVIAQILLQDGDVEENV